MEKKDKKNWLYMRFPRKIKDEMQVKELHGDIISVKMPRQKGRFCWVECESEEVAQRVRNELHKMKMEKGMLYVYTKRPVENEIKKKSKK